MNVTESAQDRVGPSAADPAVAGGVQEEKARSCVARLNPGRRPCPNQATNVVLHNCPCGHLLSLDWCFEHVQYAFARGFRCRQCREAGHSTCPSIVLAVESIR